MLRILSVLLLAIFTAAADFKITIPAKDNWWVCNSTNVLAWEYSTLLLFTVLVSNVNSTLPPLPFISLQDSTAESVLVPFSELNEGVGTGYVIHIADPRNTSNILVSSDQFEIKPLGSLYASQLSAASAASADAMAAETSTSASANPSSAAPLSAHTPSFVGLAGAIGLLAASMLGA